jgi:hypothetical protein
MNYLLAEFSEMKRYRLSCLLLAVIAGHTFSGVIVAGYAPPQGWEKTPYRSWGAADVKSILEASPWSRVLERGTALAPMMFGTETTKVSEKLVVLLRSALPVRQALLRERQLAVKYDAMSATDQAAFDAKNKALLDCPACAKYYVVSVKCPYAGCYTGTFVEDHKKLFYLTNEKGERRELAGASPLPDNKGGAIFFFPRVNDKGEVLLTTANKKLTFHFALQAMVNLDTVTEKVELDVAKLVRGGEVNF